MPTNPTPPWGSTVRNTEPLVRVQGVSVIVHNGKPVMALPAEVADGIAVTHYLVNCRICGGLDDLSVPQSASQAGVLQMRHLSEHLTLLGLEFQEASR